MKNMTIEEYIEKLASREPVPGGGGAGAFVGAIGVSLGSMVGNLTLGKKKYVKYEEDIKRLLGQAEALQAEMMELISKDAEVFMPLSDAYRLPKDTEEQCVYREEMIQKYLLDAALVPFAIMQKAAEGMDILEELLDKGSALAVSDTGVGASFLKAASDSAALNVYINTKLMKDRVQAEALKQKTAVLKQETGRRADALYSEVEKRLI